MKPCPLCGKSGELFHVVSAPVGFKITCVGCGLELWRKTANAVIRAWNRRTAAKEK